MNHSLLSIWDLVIIGAYLILMVLVGVYSVKRIKNTGDYYVAGRSFGPLVLMATVCATIIGGSGLMGRAGVALSAGHVYFFRSGGQDLRHRHGLRPDLHPGAV